MKRKTLRFSKGFRVAIGSRRCRAAEMVIEHGDAHEIRNTGRGLLKTLNLYSPPAYTRSGDELAAARP